VDLGELQGYDHKDLLEACHTAFSDEIKNYKGKPVKSFQLNDIGGKKFFVSVEYDPPKVDTVESEIEDRRPPPQAPDSDETSSADDEGPPVVKRPRLSNGLSHIAHKDSAAASSSTSDGASTSTAVPSMSREEDVIHAYDCSALIPNSRYITLDTFRHFFQGGHVDFDVRSRTLRDRYGESLLEEAVDETLGPDDDDEDDEQEYESVASVMSDVRSESSEYLPVGRKQLVNGSIVVVDEKPKE